MLNVIIDRAKWDVPENKPHVVANERVICPTAKTTSGSLYSTLHLHCCLGFVGVACGFAFSFTGDYLYTVGSNVSY